MAHEVAESALRLVREMLAHSEWADAVLFDQIAVSPLVENLEMRRRLSHMHDVRHAFRSMLSGGPPIYPPTGEPPTFLELRRLTRTSHAGIRELADQLSPEHAGRIIHIPFFPDPPCHISVLEGLTQVAMHTQHHRGQCMTRLAELGGKAENVDWIIWLWKQKPQAAW